MSEEFTVNDRRLFTKDGSLNEESQPGEDPAPTALEPEPEPPFFAGPAEAPPGSGGGPLPAPTFPGLLVGLATSALVHLGESPEPGAPSSPPDLPAAKQVIDILGILQEKTRGNLESEEEALLETLLYDLRLKYVKASS